MPYLALSNTWARLEKVYKSKVKPTISVGVNCVLTPTRKVFKFDGGHHGQNYGYSSSSTAATSTTNANVKNTTNAATASGAAGPSGAGIATPATPTTPTTPINALVSTAPGGMSTALDPCVTIAASLQKRKKLAEDGILPVTPAHIALPDPDKILEQPKEVGGLDDVKMPPTVADLTVADIDPGVFNSEMMDLGLYTRYNSEHPEVPPEYEGGNITYGTYAGTQAALTQIYERIEKTYESYFDVLQIEPTLPRILPLTSRKQIYQWARDKTFPPHLETIPAEDDVPMWKIFNALGLVETQIIVNKVIPTTFGGRTAAWLDSKAKALVGGSPEEALTVQDAVDYNMHHRKSGTDILRGENLGHLPDWYGDRRFAEQCFTGTNPITIRRANDKHFEEFLEAAKTGEYDTWYSHLKGLVEEKGGVEGADLFVHDCSYFRKAVGARDDEELVHQPGPGLELNFAVAPVTLFQLHPNGDLHPVSICVDYRGKMADSVTIFNNRLAPNDTEHDEAKDWGWRYAKTAVLTSDWVIHELDTHLTRSHFVEEAIIVATNRTVEMDHPVYKILYPHWYKTLSLNAAARDSLVPQVVMDIIGLKRDYAAKFVKYAYFEQYDFVGSYVPHELAGRGFPNTEGKGGLGDEKWKNYGYAKNILPYWWAIREYVNRMLDLEYPVFASADGDRIVAEDEQIKAWCHEVRSKEGAGIHTFPDIRTREQLVDALTMCIHIAAPYHSAVNYLQNFYQSFVPAKPPSLCFPPPMSLFQLQHYTEADLVRALPLGRQRQWLLAAQIPWLLSNKVASERSLIGFAQSQWVTKKEAEAGTKDAGIREVAEWFYLDLRRLHISVTAHSRGMGGGSVPYVVMDPGNTAVSILI